MRRNSTSAMGAFHPVLFFTFIYGISLFMALFVCSAVYKTIYGDPDMVQTEVKEVSNSTYASSEVSSKSISFR